MSDTAIKFENISKQYRLGLVSTRTLSHDLNRWWQTVVLGHEDPYLKIGETNDRTKKGTSDYVWALKDIDFSVRQGEVLGIIGKNGAGKSTLLKILSKVTSPTTGRICAKGRIASLLEVGTGFHPELTGRENIYMNGAILGMTKAEITRKLDEIVDFSGVERYLDTPAKRYSSGMTVRLGFAIAAHLEPEILVVDEVLAVGDAEFQKKAIGKMQDVSKGEGRTVLFVSHNMGSIRSLCNKGIVMKDGGVVFSGLAEDAVTNYLSDNFSEINETDLLNRHDRKGNGKIRFTKVTLLDKRGEKVDTVLSGDYIKINLDYQINDFSIKKNDLIIGITILGPHQEYLGQFISDEVKTIYDSSENKIELVIPKLMLRGGTYYLRLFSHYKDTQLSNFCDCFDVLMPIKVISSDYWNTGRVIRDANMPLIDGYFRL
ncbi:MAG: ABC transporter ATP-binding protein [Bacteroidales bacterium]